MMIAILGRVRRAMLMLLAAPIVVCCEGVAPSGNLVLNAGFEEMAEGGEPANWDKQSEGGVEGSVRLDSSGAHGGRSSLRIENANGKGYIHPMQRVVIRPGAYLYSVWARSDSDVIFSMQIYDTRAWAGGKAPDDIQVRGATGHEFKLPKDTWRRFEMYISATAEFPASLQIGLRQRGRLWLDDVEVVPTEPRLIIADTGRPHPEGIGAAELEKREGWKAVPGRGAAFVGDAWFGNQYVGIAFRQGAGAAEFYARMPGGAWRKLSDLMAVGADGRRGGKIQSLRIVEDHPDEIAMDAAFARDGARPMTVRYRLQRDRRHIETEAREGARRMIASCDSKFAVVPDWFGGDLVTNAERTRAARLRAPSEKVLLQLLDGGDAILVFAWPSADQEVAVGLSGEGEGRVICETEIGYRRDQRASVWIGALTAPAIWHQKPIRELTEIQGDRLSWKMPFDAGWRIDFRRQQDGLIDSWKPTFRHKDGNWEYCRDNGSRTMWTSCRGDVAYPAFIQDGCMHLVNARFESAMQQTFFRGDGDLSFDPDDVALVYPWESTDATPRDFPMARDILHQAFETTPEFQYASRLEPVDMPRHRYPPTCAVTAEYEKAFEQGEETKGRRRLIADLRRMDYFVLTKRERIEEYMSWMRRQRDWIERQRTAAAANAPLLDRMAMFLARIDDTYSKGRGANMKTPAECLDLADRVEALIDAPADSGDTEGSDKCSVAKDLGKKTRAIGGAQDSVLGCMRQIVKELRQTAGIAMMQAKDDAEFNCAAEMRKRTMELLWQTCGHEWR